MIVSDLHVISVAIAELETNPPRSIDGHGPLALAVTLEPVKADAFEWAQPVKGWGRIEHLENFKGIIEIKA